MTPARAFLAAALSLTVAACGVVTPPAVTPSVVSGPCSLTVGEFRAEAVEDVTLQPPYEVNLQFRPRGDEAVIDLSGTGWGATRITMTGPGKALDYFRYDWEGLASHFLPAPGVWHFTLLSEVCSAAFDVVAKPRIVE